MKIPSYASQEMRLSINNAFIGNGVVIIDPQNTYIDEGVKIASGAIIYPNVCIEGETSIGADTTIHIGCVIKDTTVGSGCTLRYVNSDSVTIGDNVTIGPFVNLRPDTNISNNCKVGDFVEIKKAFLDEGSKVPHLSYVGDATIGKKVNIGCGVIFANYNGYKKQHTTVGDSAFVGSNSNLVAPVEIGKQAFVAAGSTITRNVPDGALAVERSDLRTVDGWVEHHKRKNLE